MEKKFKVLEDKDTSIAENFLKTYYEVRNCSKLIVVDNVEEFNTVLYHYCASKKGNYVFRGISAKEQKYCGITRKYYPNKRNEQIDDYIKRHFNEEILHIRKFEQKAGYLLQNYTMPIDLVSTAQHYGLRTRLIDWTSSPLIATLFSLHGEIPENDKNESDKNVYYLVFAANKSDNVAIHNLTTGNTEEDRIDMYSNRYIVYEKMLLELIKIYKCRKKDRERVEHYFKNILKQTHTHCALSEYANDEISKHKTERSIVGICNKMTEGFINDKILFLETNFTNTRIVNQHGLFQIVIDISKKYIDKLLKNVEIIAISENARENIKDYCKRLGISDYDLMPDLEMIAKSINEKVKN